jgi:hypothetical protein
MAIPSYPITTFIPGSACIGDSRTTLNANFSALDFNLTSLNTSISTASLSARFINIVHAPFNDSINPNLFIGEVGNGTGGSITGSLTGFNTTYDESANKLNISSQQGSVSANIVTYTLNNNVGIGTTAPNQTLTVNGIISATGFASVSALQINNSITQATGLSSYNTVAKFPIYNATGSIIGYIPIYNF